MFSNTRHLRIEWGDCDPAGIVFYPRYFAMFDHSTTTLITSVEMASLDMALTLVWGDRESI